MCQPQVSVNNGYYIVSLTNIPCGLWYIVDEIRSRILMWNVVYASLNSERYCFTPLSPLVVQGSTLCPYEILLHFTTLIFSNNLMTNLENDDDYRMHPNIRLPNASKYLPSLIIFIWASGILNFFTNRASNYSYDILRISTLPGYILKNSDEKSPNKHIWYKHHQKKERVLWI